MPGRRPRRLPRHRQASGSGSVCLRSRFYAHRLGHRNGVEYLSKVLWRSFQFALERRRKEVFLLHCSDGGRDKKEDGYLRVVESADQNARSI